MSYELWENISIDNISHIELNCDEFSTLWVEKHIIHGDITPKMFKKTKESIIYEIKQHCYLMNDYYTSNKKAELIIASNVHSCFDKGAHPDHEGYTKPIVVLNNSKTIQDFKNVSIRTINIGVPGACMYAYDTLVNTLNSLIGFPQFNMENEVSRNQIQILGGHYTKSRNGYVMIQNITDIFKKGLSGPTNGKVLNQSLMLDKTDSRYRQILVIAFGGETPRFFQIQLRPLINGVRNGKARPQLYHKYNYNATSGDSSNVAIIKYTLTNWINFFGNNKFIHKDINIYSNNCMKFDIDINKNVANELLYLCKISIGHGERLSYLLREMLTDNDVFAKTSFSRSPSLKMIQNDAYVNEKKKDAYIICHTNMISNNKSIEYISLRDKVIQHECSKTYLEDDIYFSNYINSIYLYKNNYIYI